MGVGTTDSGALMGADDVQGGGYQMDSHLKWIKALNEIV